MTINSFSPFLILILSLLLSITACKPQLEMVDFNQPTSAQGKTPYKFTDFDPIKDYKASETFEHDLIHTALKVSFDWDNAHLLGEARLQFKPHFYSTNKVILDARGFDIHSIDLVKPNTQPLKYEYIDSAKLHIELDKVYTRNDLIELKIKYTAKPNELDSKGHAAINDDKGLYFINPDGTEDKPQQIWTQGETESNSCWFPTFDAPNQKSTQEIWITVQDRFETLSNGLLLSSKANTNGTRTDYWKQDIPHAPYLFVMAIGDYAIVKDKWRNIDVHYYVEHEYEKDAHAIFGKTPKVLEHFSTQFGVDYPWEKCHQVIVRDYVSGAMENTGAIVYGEFVQRTAKQLVDKNYEDYIAHEMMHQWFGDLVTCESWSNLALNEALATYGEYLWDEAEYGRMEADYTLMETLDIYLDEAIDKQEDLIRYYYKSDGDMFDSHSYNKGGCIMHLLRYTIGDEAFFAGLNNYLEKYKFQAVEHHQLRMAFEEVCGQDLNWFFNQWFLGSGHPILSFKYNYSDSVSTVTIKQEQDLSYSQLFELPLEIDFYFADGHVKKEKVRITDKVHRFDFPVTSKPILINSDASKSLLGETVDFQNEEAFLTMYNKAPLFEDKREALFALSKEQRSDAIVEVFMDALNADHFYLRGFAMDNFQFKNWEKDGDFLAALEKIAKTDPKPQIRAKAIYRLAKASEEYEGFINNLLETEDSYWVINGIMRTLADLNPKRSLDLAREHQNNPDLTYGVAKVLRKHGELQDLEWFKKAYDQVDYDQQSGLIDGLADLLLVIGDDDEIMKQLPFFERVARTGDPSWIRYAGMDNLSYFTQYFKVKPNKGLLANQDKMVTQLERRAYEEKIEEIKQLMKSITKDEKDEELLRDYEEFLEE